MANVQHSPQNYTSDYTTVPVGDAKRPPTDSSRTEGTANAKRALTDLSQRPKAQLFVMVFHWSMAILITLHLLTGMRLGWSYMESWLGAPTGTWAGWLNATASQGRLLGVNLIILHVNMDFLMYLVIGVYVGYLLWSKSSRCLRERYRDIQGILTWIRMGGFWRNKQALWSANVIVYWVALAFIFVFVLRGADIYWAEWEQFEPLGGYDIMRLLRGLTAYLFLPYIIVYVTLQWIFGRRF